MQLNNCNFPLFLKNFISSDKISNFYFFWKTVIFQTQYQTPYFGKFFDMF